MRRLIQATGKDLPVPTAVGLERGGEVLIKPTTWTPTSTIASTARKC
jgi:hypothetical protein